MNFIYNILILYYNINIKSRHIYKVLYVIKYIIKVISSYSNSVVRHWIRILDT